MGPNLCDGCPYEKWCLRTEERPCEDTGGRLPSTHHGQGPRRTQPCQHFNLGVGLLASRATVRETLFKWRGLWHFALAKQMNAGTLGAAWCTGVASSLDILGCSSFCSRHRHPSFHWGLPRSSHLLLGARHTQACPACTPSSGCRGINPSFVSTNEVPLESRRPGERF